MLINDVAVMCLLGKIRIHTLRTTNDRGGTLSMKIFEPFGNEIDLFLNWKNSITQFQSKRFKEKKRLLDCWNLTLIKIRSELTK